MAGRRSPMPARIERHEAIVLRTLRYGESDVIAHLFTLDEGRINAIAKRGRSAKTSIGARLEPYTQVTVQLARSRSGGLSHVRTVDLARPVRALRDQWRRQQAAAAALDTLGRLFEEGQASEASYHLSVRLLDLLDRADALTPTPTGGIDADGEGGDAACALPPLDEDQRIAALLVGYQLKLLHLFGAAPSLSTCVRCGVDEPGRLTSWSPGDGGVVCESCRGEGDMAIVPGTRDAAVWLLRASLAEVAAAPELPADRDIRGASQRVVSTLFERHAGFRPKLPTG